MAPFRAPFVAAFVASFVASFVIPAHAAEFIPNPSFVPKADTYICPNSPGGAVECYLEAVAHLYTMCRNVKSIEIIEFGYEKSDEGVNGAKTTYCIDKHGMTLKRIYQGAVRKAGKNKAAVEALHSLSGY